MSAPPPTLPTPSPNAARNLVVAGAAVAVLGGAILVVARGDLTDTLLGACCGLGGILLIVIAFLGRKALLSRPSAAPPAGSPAIGPASAAPGTPAPAPESGWACGKCGADLVPGASFCGKCGEPVEE